MLLDNAGREVSVDDGPGVPPKSHLGSDFRSLSRKFERQASEDAAASGKLVEQVSSKPNEAGRIAMPTTGTSQVSTLTKKDQDQESQGSISWAVQVGSFAKRENAVALERRLRKKGYSAFVKEFFGSKGNVYRVRVGPELLRAEAKELRAQLQRELELDGMMVRYP
jgi:cell division septation protein DedD